MMFRHVRKFFGIGGCLLLLVAFVPGSVQAGLLSSDEAVLWEITNTLAAKPEWTINDQEIAQQLLASGNSKIREKIGEHSAATGLRIMRRMTPGGSTSARDVVWGITNSLTEKLVWSPEDRGIAQLLLRSPKGTIRLTIARWIGLHYFWKIDEFIPEARTLLLDQNAIVRKVMETNLIRQPHWAESVILEDANLIINPNLSPRMVRYAATALANISNWSSQDRSLADAILATTVPEARCEIATCFGRQIPWDENAYIVANKLLIDPDEGTREVIAIKLQSARRLPGNVPWDKSLLDRPELPASIRWPMTLDLILQGKLELKLLPSLYERGTDSQKAELHRRIWSHPSDEFRSRAISLLSPPFKYPQLEEPFEAVVTAVSTLTVQRGGDGLALDISPYVVRNYLAAQRYSISLEEVTSILQSEAFRERAAAEEERVRNVIGTEEPQWETVTPIRQQSVLDAIFLVIDQLPYRVETSTGIREIPFLTLFARLKRIFHPVSYRHFRKIVESEEFRERLVRFNHSRESGAQSKIRFIDRMQPVFDSNSNGTAVLEIIVNLVGDRFRRFGVAWVNTGEVRLELEKKKITLQHEAVRYFIGRALKELNHLYRTPFHLPSIEYALYGKPNIETVRIVVLYALENVIERNPLHEGTFEEVAQEVRKIGFPCSDIYVREILESPEFESDFARRNDERARFEEEPEMRWKAFPSIPSSSMRRSHELLDAIIRLAEKKKAEGETIWITTDELRQELGVVTHSQQVDFSELITHPDFLGIQEINNIERQSRGEPVILLRYPNIYNAAPMMVITLMKEIAKGREDGNIEASLIFQRMSEMSGEGRDLLSRIRRRITLDWLRDLSEDPRFQRILAAINSARELKGLSRLKLISAFAPPPRRPPSNVVRAPKYDDEWSDEEGTSAKGGESSKIVPQLKADGPITGSDVFEALIGDAPGVSVFVVHGGVKAGRPSNATTSTSSWHPDMNYPPEKYREIRIVRDTFLKILNMAGEKGFTSLDSHLMGTNHPRLSQSVMAMLNAIYRYSQEGNRGIEQVIFHVSSETERKMVAEIIQLGDFSPEGARRIAKIATESALSEPRNLQIEKLPDLIALGLLDPSVLDPLVEQAHELVREIKASDKSIDEANITTDIRINPFISSVGRAVVRVLGDHLLGRGGDANHYFDKYVSRDLTESGEGKPYDRTSWRRGLDPVQEIRKDTQRATEDRE